MNAPSGTGPETALLKRDCARRGELSERATKGLTVYAAAAGAACAGALMGATPASARVVFTPLRVVIGPGTTYTLGRDANFLFTNGQGDLIVMALATFSCCTTNFFFGGVEVNASHPYLPLALSRGAKIGSSQLFSPKGETWVNQVMAGRGNNGESGNFVNVKDRYLGLRFTRLYLGDVYYGWARFTVYVKPDHQVEALLTGYAYESAEGVPIHAGQASGSVDNPVYAPEPGTDGAIPDEMRSEPEPISQAGPAASLGLLALGAQGLPFWRRESQISLAAGADPAS